MNALNSLSVDCFYFVRHGETTDNRDDIISGGERDVTLSEKGEHMALCLAPQFALLTDITHIYCSPMKRAQKTAQHINRMANKPLITANNLHEWLVGSCAGQPEKEYGEKLSAWSFDPPEGETREQLKQRVSTTMVDCFQRSSQGKILFVAHAGVWLAAAACLGLPVEKIDNTTLFRLQRQNGIWQKNKV